MSMTDIPHDALMTAFKAICPDKADQPVQMAYGLPTHGFSPQEIQEHVHDYAVFLMIERLLDNCNTPESTLHELVKQHMNRPKIQTRSYQLVYQLHFKDCLPRVKFIDCIATEMFDKHRDVKAPYCKVDTVYINSLKDRIDIPEYLADQSVDRHDYSEIEIDIHRIPCSIFENFVWRILYESNQYNDSLTVPPDEYDEDYL